MKITLKTPCARVLWLSGALLLVNANLAWAQSTPLPASLPAKTLPLPKPSAKPAQTLTKSPAKTVAVGRDYRLGPDDVIAITVQRHPEFSVEQAVVPVSGSLSVPVIGPVKVTGKTIEELDAEITEKFKVRLLKPEVSVELRQPKPTPIYVVGQVAKPGIYEFKDGWRITQALAAAGGLSVRADLVYATVSRGSRKVADTPLTPLLGAPTRKENVVLQIGDTVQFYERVVQVNVTGEVNKPGLYTLPVGSGAVEALSVAGGPTASAALTRVVINRANGKTAPVNLYKAAVQGDKKSNVKLQEGDFLIVPEFKDRISVLGAVAKPGFYGIEDGRPTTIADALAKSGGTLPNAALTKATVKRGDGTLVSVDLYQILVKGNRASDIVLGPDDIVSLPEARGVTVLGEVAKPGTYKMEEGTLPRVTDALALGGGLAIKPEQARINVARTMEDGKLVSLNVDAVGLLELSDLAQNGRIQDGDIVSVSAVKKSTVFIQGEVKLPGAYELEEGDSIPELIARAGGPTVDAALTQVSVTRRGGAAQSVDVARAVLRGDAKLNLPLTDGDLVVVPRSQNRVLVMPAVNRPGSYAIPEDRPLTIGEAISLAGGPRNLAKLKEIALIRQSANGVEQRVFSLNRIENGRLSINEIVQNGDLIYVPEQNVSASGLRNALSLAGGIASVGRLFVP